MRLVGVLAIVVALIAALPAAPEAVPQSNLQFSQHPLEQTGGQLILRATVGWNNAWRNARNHDAMWLFVKVRVGGRGPWQHARVQSVVPTTPVMACAPSSDHIGAFCAPSGPHRGRLSSELRLSLDVASLSRGGRVPENLDAQLFGIEMVQIPAGAFSVGDPDPRSVEFASFYRSDANGGHDGSYRIESEDPITVSPSAGALYYRSNSPQYTGDRAGPIPAEFPKGAAAFYAMKYEIRQGQYAAFLNSIGAEASHFRAIHGGIGYYDHRGSIRLDRGEFVADNPGRPANWISWDDGTAFADWAGLRPMTEFEFTKSARGPETPGNAEYPWGTNTLDQLQRKMGPDGDLLQSGDADESLLTDHTRDRFGASYYWVMDLAGSVWERVVTPGHPRGRGFRGTHGDGQLARYGMANNADWPSGDHDGGGYGYRGGGHYEAGQAPGPFTPYSPVEWRSFGSWGGAPRSVAYGFRAVRTAE